MTDRPIIFSPPMILALLDGRKTQTRRLLYSVRRCEDKIIPDHLILNGHPPPISPDYDHYYALTGWHKVKPADRLWVRERYSISANGYFFSEAVDGSVPIGWRPSIHMPRSLSRLTLEVTAVKIERLQKISPEDARDEGVNQRSPKVRQFSLFGADWKQRDAIYLSACVWEFEDLWRSLHGDESWLKNPEVVAITFKLHRSNIDALPKAA